MSQKRDMGHPAQLARESTPPFAMKLRRMGHPILGRSVGMGRGKENRQRQKPMRGSSLRSE